MLVAAAQRVEEECAGFGVVCAGGGGYDDLVGVFDGFQPHGVGFVVAGVDEDEPVVLADDVPDEVDVVGVTRWSAASWMGWLRSTSNRSAVWWCT